jgi:anti-sigma-K factor RskA
MNDNLHIADADLALYAMGALSAAEMDAARAHVSLCARCREEVRQNTLALAAYSQTTPETALPAGAKDRFMARLSESPQASRTTPAAVSIPNKKPAGKSRSSLSDWFASIRWTGALAGAMALLAIAIGIDDLHKRAEIDPLLAQAQRGQLDSAQLAELMELLTSPQAQKVALHPGPVAAPQPEGRVVYASHSGKLLLTASNLHPLPAGKIYELWILQPGGKKPLPAGTFAPDSSGNAAMVLADEPVNLAVQGFGVTVENSGGSDTPTLPIVLSGL